MTRTLLALIVVTAGSAVTVTTKHAHHHMGTVQSGRVVSREPELRASRWVRRPPLPGRAHHARVHDRRRWFDITMYCATGHHTASGAWPSVGMAAGNRWPFGTRLHIDGYGTVTVTDRIGWGSDVDIFGGNDPGCERRALAWGRRRLAVEVAA